jgi:hypothetical protein
MFSSLHKTFLSVFKENCGKRTRIRLPQSLIYSSLLKIAQCLHPLMGVLSAA